MKYIVLVPDGAADRPIDELGGKTPLEVARTTNMDHIAQHGVSGIVHTIPRQMKPGSDVGNLSVLGYDPQKYYSGRAPLEAANLGIDLGQHEIAFRCNLVTISDHKMIDYSAGHISSEEATQLIDALNRLCSNNNLKFFAGKSYRHLAVFNSTRIKDLLNLQCTPPHDILEKDISRYLPKGKQSEVLLRLMEQSKKIFENHTVNQVRVDLKENPANMIWLWGQGLKPQLPSFEEKYGVRGSIISAVDLVNGIGRLAGLNVIKVPGATGYYDTNYQAKASYALESLKDRDFVFVHVEATDEAGHNGDLKMKIHCLERFDREVVGTVLNHFDCFEHFRVLVVPDHPTPIKKRTHTSDAVPFAMFGKGLEPNGGDQYSEKSAQKRGYVMKNGEELMQIFIKKYC